MKKNVLFSLICATMFIGTSVFAQATRLVKIVPAAHPQNQTIAIPDGKKTKIQVAILLDTSNSMDGLIEQTKSRLWNIVNTLTTLRYGGEAPRIEIALYEYGNDHLPNHDGYIRQVTPMTTDLDLISETLFGLRTNGGSEYCGMVVQQAVRKLDWGRESSDMKLIYIAGNEEFNQGSISYKEAISEARKKDIFVNTIHCGSYNEGVGGYWKDGAELGKGKYFAIDANHKVVYILTPYDDRIASCNDRLNRTYISYGAIGESKQKNQSLQDSNASSISMGYAVERTVSKSSRAYTNSNWDLVDRVKEDNSALAKIDKKELPKEMQNKSTEELQKMIAEKQKERDSIQKEIADLAKKRQLYIEQESNKAHNDKEDLGIAINNSVIEFANAKGYVVGK